MGDILSEADAGPAETHLSVDDVLEMPVLRTAGPAVLAGSDGLHRRVRWVHSAELVDIATLLREGDLLLSTGIAMPDTGPELQRFAASLTESGVAGLVIELGRRWQSVPTSLVSACEALGLPLISLTHEVRFAAVAQEVGERIVSTQLAELREAQRIHETFTDLSLQEAGPDAILEAVQRLSGAAVVLEGDQHQVLDYRAGPTNIDEFLAGWPTRSREVVVDGRTHWDSERGWLITRVGRRDRGWGRLVVQLPSAPSEGLVAVAERAAAALAMHRLHDRQRDSLVRRTHHELVLGLLNDPTSEDLLRRCELAGLPLQHRGLVGVSLRPRLEAGPASGQVAARLDAVMAATVHAADDLGVPALVCEIDRDVRLLLSVSPSANATSITDDLAARVAQRHPVLVAAGRPALRVSEVDRTLRESQHVLVSIRQVAASGVVHRLEDVHLRGLLTMLGNDERVRFFVDRELGPLRVADAEGSKGLVDTLRALLTHPTSKAEAAASLHMSRPVFYDRLARIEKVLGTSLDDPDIRTSLHVALIAEDVADQGG